MKISRSSFSRSSANVVLRVSLAVFTFCVLIRPAGADTDLSSTPLQGSSAAQVKPNIMLLMDASGSMGWSHMPDEVETITGYGSIGYKNTQCNALYYNPNQIYAIPKDANGNPFPLPSFGGAPYAGYIGYYSAADKADIDPVGVSSGLNNTTVDLSAAFKAYDRHQLYQTFHDDTPQKAYYFTYSGVQALKYSTAPCTDADTSAPNNVGQTFAATGGGTWTKVIVSATSGVGATDERQNFAIWYSFYRTRMALIKSAASLAFTPLTDSFRVGFITVEPKDSPTAPAINPARYVSIQDFGPSQRTLWFGTLFAQSPFGASPAREGLARVGRYYAGVKNDGINNGMSDDPLLYSCQQNFTILTTDGYWNAQHETPGGGPVKIDGTTHVGQQDGNLPYPAPQLCPDTDPYCPRPIYDGYSGNKRVDTDVQTLYADQGCGLATLNRTQYQTIADRSQLLKTQTSTTQRVQYYTESEAQWAATTTQMTQVQSQVKATTDQYIALTTTLVEDRYQVKQSKDTTTLKTEQWKTQKIQTTAQTKQTTETKYIYYTAKSQFRTTTTQYQTVKTQFQAVVDQYTLNKVQTIKHVYQTIQTDTGNESQSAISGTCVTGGTIYCSTTEIFGPAPSDTCSQGVGPGPAFIKTDCTPGPNTLADTYVASCTVGVDPATAANSYTKTTCTKTNKTPSAFVASCTLGVTTGPGPAYLVTTCTQPSGANNATAFVSSCTVGTDPATSANSYVTTVCSKPGGANNQVSFVASCTPGTTAGTSGNSWVTTVCDKPAPNNFAATAGAVCTVGVVAGTSANSWVTTTCTRTLQSATPKAPASCVASGPTSVNGWVDTTCPSANVAPHATAAAVDTTVECTSGTGVFVGGGPNFIVTTCAAGPNTQAATAGAVCTVGTTAAASTNSWTTTICTKPTDIGPVASPFCTSNGGPTSATSWIKTTCVTTVTQPPTPVDPTTCPVGPPTSDSTSPYTRTTCAKVGLAALGGVCVPSNSGAPNWIIRDCGPVAGGGPVPSCTPGTTTVGNVTTVCSHNVNTAYAPSCANTGPSSPNYITTTCDPQTPVSTVGVDPTTCNAGTGPGPAYVTTTCPVAAAGPYSSEGPIASCTIGYSAVDHLIYACRQPPETNYTHNVASCTPGSVPPTSGNGYITYGCVYTDTTSPAAGPAPTYCDEQTASGLNSWTTKTCTTVAVGAPNTPAPNCMETPSIHCTSTGVQTSMPVDSCPSAGGSPDYYQWNCHDTAPSLPVVDPGCLGGTGPGPNFWKTNCTPGVGVGSLRVSTTTTTTTTTNATGPATISSVVGPTVQVDGVCYASPLPFPNPNPQVQPTVTVNSALPGGSVDSLADVAQYYYKTDLRPTMADDVKSKGVLAEDDKATHQHMVTYTLGLGVSGTLNYQSDYKTATSGDFADIRTGAKVWPLWPDPNIDYTGVNAVNWEDKRSIDDFWHTAVDGRGIYFSANNPTSVVSGLSRALNGISASLASSTGQGVSNLNPVAGDNFSYTATYMTGDWTGDVVANTINLTTGALDPTPLWSAQTILDGMTKAQCDNRNIYLARAGATNGMVPFTWNTDTCASGVPSGTLDTQLNGTEQAYFGSTLQPLPVSLLSQYNSMSDGTLGSPNQRGTAVGSNLLNYVRGQRGFEPFVPSVANSLYRERVHVLGDVVDSQPVYVKTPFAAYTDAGYDSFKATMSGRLPMVYVGANDGMLHAFYAGTSTIDPLKGQEAWAIIPSSVLPNLYKLADDNYKNVHQFYVDGTPVVGDVYDSGSASWKTVLVTGLNDGGKAYMAVDVTTPTSPKTLWEFKWDSTVCPAAEPSPAAHGNAADCHLGYSYGKPVITKQSDGTWVVLVTSGYNNINAPAQAGDGVGYLYVLDAMSGTIKAKISTGVGGPANPAGLAQINNFVDNALVDNTTVRAYGGDLLGNIWRFDISGTPAVTLLGTATDKVTGNPQAITTRPELAEVNNKPMVFVGTGRYLGGSDIAIQQQQSVYGFLDPLTAGPVYAAPDLRTALQPLVMTDVGSPVTSRTVACDSSAPTGACTRTAGWVVDLSEAGERVNIDMQLFGGTLIVGSNVPQDTACSSGGHSWINYFDYATGLAVSNDPGATVSQYLANSLLVGLSTIALPPQAGFNNPTVRNMDMFGNGQSGVTTPPLKTQPPSGKRVSWREIVQ